MATNGPTTHGEYQPNSAAPAPASTTSEQSSPNLGKDEVAWFFVEQYYTTLSKTPEKLHLFYGKRSQFVYGQEGQTANVSVGRQTIQERIKDLDFQNCKVRVSNVDSQASFDNIVIQVIGETSNKGSTPKKFVQTFVLAQQPSGYFVLNDILRYIDEEGDEEPAEAVEEAEPAVEAEAPAAVAEEVKEAEPVEEQPAVEEPASLDPSVVEQKLEEVATEEPASVNGDAVPEPASEAPAAAPEPASTTAEEADKPAVEPETTAQKPVEETPQEPEKPLEPTPTPVATRKPAAPAPAPAPAAPPKPMTWASRAAAAAGPPKVSPAMPLTKAAPVPAPTRPAAAAAAAAPTAAQPAAPAAQATEPAAAAAPAKEAGTEWQTAGSDSKRQNRPQSISGPPAEKEGTLGYVKYVTDKVVREDLEAALTQYGELAYFDINRQKNCAFVEFKTPAGYQAAVAANPHVVNGENIVVEPRRPKAGAYGGVNYSTGRPNMPNRGGRGGFDGNRSGSHGGRGSFGGQNRGRGGLTRGRGASQAANA